MSQTWLGNLADPDPYILAFFPRLSFPLKWPSEEAARPLGGRHFLLGFPLLPRLRVPGFNGTGPRSRFFRTAIDPKRVSRFSVRFNDGGNALGIEIVSGQ